VPRQLPTALQPIADHLLAVAVLEEAAPRPWCYGEPCAKTVNNGTMKGWKSGQEERRRERGSGWGIENNTCEHFLTRYEARCIPCGREEHIFIPRAGFLLMAKVAVPRELEVSVRIVFSGLRLNSGHHSMISTGWCSECYDVKL
jgi:hypothetical protein